MTIDLHGHYTPRAFVEQLERRSGYPTAERSHGVYTIQASPQSAFTLEAVHHDLDQRRERLDALGYKRQLVSLSAAYGFDRLRGSEAADVAEAVNAALREAASVDRERYPVLAVAPVEGDESGVTVLRRALDAGQRGMILSASTVARLPEFALLEPLLQLIHERGGIVFIHPGSQPELGGLPPTRVGISGTAFQNELTAALLRLLDWGALVRFPGLKLICCNLGGTVPLLIERWQHMGGETLLPQLRQIVYDCSSFGPRGIQLAVEAFGEEQIVIGSDYPVQPLERPLAAMDGATLSLAAREAILSKNAERLLADA